MSGDDTLDENEATSDDTILDEADETSDETGDEFSPFDEIAEDFKPSEIKKVIASDGMPTQYAPQSKSDIPALSTESLVCMEDLSMFVVRGMHGDIIEEFFPEEVERMPDGNYYVKDDTADNKQRRKSVTPLRPRCEHYVRQMTQFDHNADAKAHLRLCAARRTTEGTFMTLRDSAMWACSMREPRDLITEESLLDKFDRDKIEAGRNRQHFSIFDMGDKSK